MLIILMGKTCSGKDTVAKELINRGWNRILTYTTRKRRRGEKKDVVYHFINDDEFDEKIAADFFLEHKEYTIADGSVVRYGSPKDELTNDNGNDFIIMTPSGYKDFLKKSDRQHVAIYLYANDQTITSRLKKRGDSAKEAERRLIADRVDFKDCECLADKIVYNNDKVDIEDVVDKIIKIAEEKHERYKRVRKNPHKKD